jgi:hypothetical protein
MQHDTGRIKRGENLNFFPYSFWNVMFYFQPDATNGLGERIMGKLRYIGAFFQICERFYGFLSNLVSNICNKNKVSNFDLEQRSSM